MVIVRHARMAIILVWRVRVNVQYALQALIACQSRHQLLMRQI